MSIHKFDGSKKTNKNISSAETKNFLRKVQQMIGQIELLQTKIPDVLDQLRSIIDVFKDQDLVQTESTDIIIKMPESINKLKALRQKATNYKPDTI